MGLGRADAGPELQASAGPCCCLFLELPVLGLFIRLVARVEAWHAGMWPGLSYGGMTLMVSRGKDTCFRH